MTADVVESTNLVVFATDEKDRVAAWECRRVIVTRLGEDR